jgi:phosphoribosyl-AMP cyclohydrolase
VNCFDQLKFDDQGLIGAIIQDHIDARVLMFAWCNRESLEKTVETGLMHFYSRSRRRLWLKGETSGHLQRVKSITVDCDADVLLVRVEQAGVACHEGYRSCFFRELDAERDQWTIVGTPQIDPRSAYPTS